MGGQNGGEGGHKKTFVTFKETHSHLDGTGRTELVEGALRHLGEDSGHRIFSLFRGLFGHGEDVGAVLGELAAEEEVHEVDLTDDVDQVEELAQEELHGVELRKKEM